MIHLNRGTTRQLAMVAVVMALGGLACVFPRVAAPLAMMVVALGVMYVVHLFKQRRGDS